MARAKIYKTPHGNPNPKREHHWDEYNKNTPEEVKKANSRKGGIRSGEVRRQNRERAFVERNLSVALERLMAEEFVNKETGDTQNYYRSVVKVLLGRALKGDTKALQMIIEWIGQKPAEKHELTTNAADPLNLYLVALDPHDKDGAKKLRAEIEKEAEEAKE